MKDWPKGAPIHMTIQALQVGPRKLVLNKVGPRPPWKGHPSSAEGREADGRVCVCGSGGLGGGCGVGGFFRIEMAF